MSAPLPMPVDIVSDFVCPWCYVGRRRLQAALALLGDEGEAVAVRYRPFFLNPWVPRDGMARSEFLRTKFGARDFTALYASVVEAGAAEGIPFDFNAIRVQPQTVDAHRLMLFARQSGAEDALAEALFRGFFVEGQDIGNPRVLVALGETAGLEPEATERFLASGEETGRVIREAQKAVDACVEGVPFFMIGSVLSVSGAQSAPALAQALQEARSRRVALRGP